jgi:hypothetical protein
MPNKMRRNGVSGPWANAVAWSPGGASRAADSAFVTILPDVAIPVACKTSFREWTFTDSVFPALTVNRLAVS